ncbi:MAG TPA: hypothetical protein ENN22_14715 [bacterium]|nr:hypothetical protein [bacterium]
MANYIATANESYDFPYHRHDLSLISETVKHKQQTPGPTFEQTKSHISDKGIETDIALENNQIHDRFSGCFIVRILGKIIVEITVYF